MDDVDVVIVGGGTTGLSAALALVRARRRVLVLDGGQPRNGVAPHSHGVLGMDGIPPHELLARGRSEVEGYGGRIEAADVRAAHVDGDGFLVEHDAGTTRARRLLIATGARDELPPIDGLAERWGTGVVVCPYCDGWERRNEIVGVIATSPASAQQAAMLRQWADRVVYFEHDSGPAAPEDRRRLEARGIGIVPGPVAAVEAAGDQVTGLRTADGVVHEVGALFTGPRLVPRDALLLALGATTTERFGIRVVEVDPDGRTSVAGVFAAGNVIDPRSNVPVSMGWGSLVGAAVNGDLLAEDERLAVAAAG